jgi:uncharacterized membrane protein
VFKRKRIDEEALQSMIEERPFLKSNNYGWGLIIGVALLIALLVYNIYFFATSENANLLYAALFGFFVIATILYFYTFYAMKYAVKDNDLILTGFLMRQVIPIKDIVSLKPAPTKPSEYRKLIYKYPTRKFSTFTQNRWVLTWLEEGKTKQAVLNPSLDIIRAIKRKRIRSSKGIGGGKK